MPSLTRACAWAGALVTALAWQAAAAANTAPAPSYPTRPVHLIVPFAPGGVTDLLGRLVGEQLAAAYGQPVVIENRPGASGHVGGQWVAKSAPDGYTLLLGTIGIHAAYRSYTKLAYDPAGELQPISVLAESPNVVLVPTSSPFKTFGQLLAHEKSHPGTLNYATAGPGSSVHMVTALYEKMIGAKLNYIPYKGSGPAMIDLIGGRVDVMFENFPTGYPHLQGGKVRALAVTGKDRNPLLPDVPTVAEAGVPGYDAQSWFTLATGSGVPAAIVDKLSRDLHRIMAVAEMRTKLNDLGMTMVMDTPEQARQVFASETAKWTKAIEASGIKLD